MIYDWLLSNKELLKIIYALIICFICGVIVLKTDRLFKLSDYQGLRYFRNAFFFYGLAFFVKFILGGISNPLPNYDRLYFEIVNILFEFLIIVAGFFLFYSLIWKKVEKEKSYHSLFNLRTSVFYVVSFTITYFDFVININLFMYLSQIILFSLMGRISFKNYLSYGKKYKFLKYYLFIIILGLITWILNLGLDYFLGGNGIIKIYVYIINMVFFLLFLYGAMKITKR
tara:strand:+ start:1872 stop:2555 length:684 start_codon:yes stop_codon:yes gene_type:complete